MSNGTRIERRKLKKTPTIKEQERISRDLLEKALADPEMQPVIDSALQARGLTVDSLFPSGARNAIWSKTYTESSRARLQSDTQEIFDEVPPTNADMSLLRKIRDKVEPS